MFSPPREEGGVEPATAADGEVVESLALLLVVVGVVEDLVNRPFT